MGYRSVKVGGTEYKYVVGETFVKIRGVGVYTKDEIRKKSHPDFEYDENTETLTELPWDGTYMQEITPHDIVRKIKSSGVHLDAKR